MTPDSFARDYVRVILMDAVVERQCGIHPWERHAKRPNRLKITIELFAELGPGPMKSAPIIDYDSVRQFLNTFPSLPHTDLLETIIDEIATKCFEIKQVEACRIAVLKPDIFNEVEAAGIEAFRTRQSWNA
jgi:dihydroneopterin aldolase